MLVYAGDPILDGQRFLPLMVSFQIEKGHQETGQISTNMDEII
jgi:hypothetical protein